MITLTRITDPDKLEESSPTKGFSAINGMPGQALQN